MKIRVFLVLFLCCGIAGANVSLVKNGSFEYDGTIGSGYISTETPQYWCDVNIPENFLAWVGNDWSADLSNCLTLNFGGYSYSVGDMASVSQPVYLKDASLLYFYVRLIEDGSPGWQDNDCSAVVLIDGTEIWNSDLLIGSDDGVYAVEVNNIDVNDIELHTLTLGLRSNVGGFVWPDYSVQWDMIRFDTYCEGFGYAQEDLNLDCAVDVRDFALIAENWLLEEPNELADVYADGSVDMYDFAVIADKWRQFGSGNSDTLMAGDLNDDGIVNMVDFAMLSAEWSLSGGCLKADTDSDKKVNEKDLSDISNMWLETNWLYKVQ